MALKPKPKPTRHTLQRLTVKELRDTLNRFGPDFDKHHVDVWLPPLDNMKGEYVGLSGKPIVRGDRVVLEAID